MASMQACTSSSRATRPPWSASSTCTPACQANPSFLKGGDEILQTKLALSAIPATIYRRKLDAWSERENGNVCCIKPFVYALLSQEDIDFAVSAAQFRTKVFMVESLTWDHLIECEQIDYKWHRPRCISSQCCKCAESEPNWYV